MELVKTTSRIGTRSTKWDRYKKEGITDIIPLWVADMDFDCAPCIVEAIKERADKNIFGYTDVDDEVLDSIVNWEKNMHGSTITREQITMVTGIVYSFDALFKTTFKDSETVVFTPNYPPLFNKPIQNGIKVHEIVIEDNKMNCKKLEEVVSNNPNIKSIVLCNPHNPLGIAWSLEELMEVDVIAKKYDLTIISDEIHADLNLFGNKHTSIMSLPVDHKNHIVMASPTKAFNLAGMKVAYMIFGDTEIGNEYKKMAKDTGLSAINTFGIETLFTAYTNPGAITWLDNTKKYIEQNIIFLKEYLEENLPKAKFEIQQSTYLCWVDFTDYNLSEQFFAEMRRTGGVHLEHGSNFFMGVPERHYERINVACDKALLERGLMKLL